MVSPTERQRRRKMSLGLFAAGVAMVATVGLASVGSWYLGNSRLGTQVDTNDLEGPVRRLPTSYTALIGVTNSAGRVTSVAALALNPGGPGGAIMPISASADVGAGRTTTLRPLSASVAQRGADSFRKDVESISNISFDMAELVDEARFQQLFGSVGTINVTLAAPVSDSETGRSWDAGERSLSVEEAGQLLTATNVYAQDWYYDAARYGVWRGIALSSDASSGSAADTGTTTPGTTIPGTTVGPTATTAPVGGVAPSSSEAAAPPPGNMDEFVARLLSGPVQERGLGIVGIPDARVAEELDPELRSIYGSGGVPSVVVHDSSEAVIVGSAVAPGRLGATLDAPRYRLVVAFDSTDLEGKNFTLAQAAREAVDRLSFSKLNIPSVALLDQPGREKTLVKVARAEDLDTARAQVQTMFGGEVEARVAEEPIVGVDVEILLGRPFLATVVGPLTDYDGPYTMELNSNQPLSDSPAPTTTTIAPTTTVTDSTETDSTETESTVTDSTATDDGTESTDADTTAPATTDG